MSHIWDVTLIASNGKPASAGTFLTATVSREYDKEALSRRRYLLAEEVSLFSIRRTVHSRTKNC
jgi:hypothetical protein